MSLSTVVGDDGVVRCPWPGTAPDYVEYHDREWGRPVVDDTRLFEKICLEGFQSGLSWLTILRKRDTFRAAFDGFDFVTVAGYDETDVARLLGDAVRVWTKAATPEATTSRTLIPSVVW